MHVTVGDFKIGPHEKKYLNRVIKSSRLSYGPMTKEFEKRFSKMHGCSYGVFSNSGTSALHVSLQALKEIHGWQDGDEVIVPAVTFVATANIVLHNRMIPVFVDVDPLTYNINPLAIESKITNKTRAIIPVHLLGLPCDMQPIMHIANCKKLRVIEDSCESMFVNYQNKRVGSFGDIGCFSTYIAHLLITGVGGICTTNNPELAIKIRSLCNHGRDAIYLNIDDDSKICQEVIEKRFNFITHGHSFRATEFEAALGLGQLDHIKDILSDRKRNADYLRDGLKDVICLQHIPNDRTHSNMLFSIELYNGNRRTFISYLEANGIETRDLLPLITQPIFSEYFKNSEKDFPVANRLNKFALYIGCHNYLSKKQLDYIIKKIRRYFGK